MNDRDENAAVGGPASGSVMSIQWRTVAIAAFIVALAALVLAAIVSNVQKADTLSVVALALAILAFVIQIIIFVVQAAAAARQEVNATDVYGRTVKALAAIEEKSEGTRQTVMSISERLIDAAIGKAIPEAQAEGVSATSESLTEDVSERVREILRTAREPEVVRPQRRTGTNPDAPSPARERRRSRDRSMNVLPEGEALEAAIEVLKQCKGSEMSNLVRLGRDQALSGGRGSLGPGLRALNPYTAPTLHERGLVVRRKVPWSPTPVFQLTDLGKDAARVLMAEVADGQVLPPSVLAVRAQRKAEEEDFAKRTDPELMYRNIPIEPYDRTS